MQAILSRNVILKKFKPLAIRNVINKEPLTNGGFRIYKSVKETEEILVELPKNKEVKDIVIIEGQGIGRELVPIGLEILKLINEMFGLKLNFLTEKEYPFLDVDKWEEIGETQNRLIPQEVINLILECGAVLKGPTRTPSGARSRQSYNVGLRQELDLFANPRIAKYIGYGREEIDLTIVRENTEGLYCGLGQMFGQDSAINIRVITQEASERIVKYGFELAVLNNQDTIIVAEKPNILKETGAVFLNSAKEVAKFYPNIRLQEKIIDNLGDEIASGKIKKGIIVTTNLFGDIMSDVAAGLVGGEGVAPGANIGWKCGVFETLAGTADNLVGTNTVNPIAIIFAASQLLEYIGRPDLAKKIYFAMEEVIKQECSTPDLGGKATTQEVKKEIFGKFNFLK